MARMQALRKLRMCPRRLCKCLLVTMLSTTSRGLRTALTMSTMLQQRPPAALRPQVQLNHILSTHLNTHSSRPPPLPPLGRTILTGSAGCSPPSSLPLSC
ncbi:hypothetical protein V8C86DRAFT_2706631 [Haematococcus lacustris]